ncbi:hypothetical protein SISNIDRAFT_461738 [Sistotremastrum niveocremeum HHB9708]|uniref:Uncharacterized protein n=1 Tax=Sistotremastrum niveocremeum HHB9708 TaxID=1314777 RepID=A0A165ABU3_9AGAM|nr:hypothetical protein SISNIDRAFT_461738 [Sistotremastrum niveocremeum HHB9708]
MVHFPRPFTRGGYDFSRFHFRLDDAPHPNDPAELLPGDQWEVDEVMTIETRDGAELSPLDNPKSAFKGLFATHSNLQAANFGDTFPVFMPEDQMMSFIIFVLYHHNRGDLILHPRFWDYMLAEQIYEDFGNAARVTFTVIFVFEGRRLARIRVIRNTRIDANLFWLDTAPDY